MAIRWIAAVAVATALSGCAGESVWAPDEAVQAARYVHPGPTELTLVTSLNDRSGEGAHSALLINGSQRILFDPAGNWKTNYAPERNDVRFGMTPQMEASFMAYQSAGPYHAITQRVTVSPEVAERAMQLAMANGAVAPSMCASATSSLVRQLPGFESVPGTLFPKTLMESFDKIPGVQTGVLYGTPDKDAPDRVPHMNKTVAAALARQGGGS